MLVRYQELKGIELYAYKVEEDLYPYYLLDTIDCSETQEFKEASKKMNKWHKCVQAAILWAEKPIHIQCKVVNTIEEKRKGLQGTKKLTPGEGMYFPYNPTADVTFHQGSVTYPLDILFIRDNRVIQIESKTKVGSKDTWTCPSCDGVLEVNGGFCETNEVAVGDDLAFFGLTETDLRAKKREKKLAKASEEFEESDYSPNYSLNLSSAIAEHILG